MDVLLWPLVMVLLWGTKPLMEEAGWHWWWLTLGENKDTTEQ